MSRERVTLSQTELKRVLVLQKVLDGKMTIREAALVLGLSERQVYRLKARLKSQGPASLAHGNRGRKPAHTIPDDVRQQVVQLAQTKYRGCNYTFLSELLCEHEGKVFALLLFAVS
ncbi:helix-turn-helix domain-containing protein [Thermoanaerobacterium sp. DL9XJH110]|uniref:helix-turn-helix domain-containing protein n=1 Tax=Thermoanaerobacterium sp. DL9XJH110 TaxID=3386643 RepID=UPI003BB6A25B